jgi:hypothetical protein
MASIVALVARCHTDYFSTRNNSNRNHSCIFHAARHLRLIDSDETGFGWSNAEICDLSDRIRITVDSDPNALDELPSDIRIKLFEGLNLSSAA